MKLYDITEDDVVIALKKGKREIQPDGKITVIHHMGEKFKYPVKVIAVQKERSQLIITTYPLKEGGEKK